MTLKPFLGIGLWLLWFPAVLPAQTADSLKSLKIIYTGSLNYSISPDLVEAVETLLSEDSEHVRLQKVSWKISYYSNGSYLMDPPKDVLREHLPGRAAKSAQKKEATILESARAIVLQYPDETGYPLMEKIYESSQNRRKSAAYVPGAEMKKAAIAEFESPAGGILRVLETGDQPVSEFWPKTLEIQYHLLVDGREATVAVFGKTLGGPSRMHAALKKRISEIETPALKLNIGNWSMDEEWIQGLGGDPDAYMKSWQDLGFERLSFYPSDLKPGLDLFRNRGFRFVGSNLEKTKPESEVPFEPFVIEEAGGIRVAVVSLLPLDANPGLASDGLPLVVRDPIEKARQIVKELRQKHSVDVVLAVSYLTSEQDAKLVSDVFGIDILLGDSVSEAAIKRKTTVELSGWGKEISHKPALMATRPRFSFGEITLRFQRSENGNELVSIVEDTPGPVGSELPEKERLSEFGDKLLDYYLAPKETILPDPRKLWPAVRPPKLTYRTPEVFNLGAHIVREATRAEVALLRIRSLESNSIGEVPENYVRSWFGFNKKIVLTRLPGRAIRALMKNMDFQPVPAAGDDEVSERKYYYEVWLAAAGLEEAGMVSGLPLQDQEFYSVALTEDLLAETDALPSLKRAVDKTETGLMAGEVVVDWLKKRKKLKETEEKIKSGEAARRDYDEELRSLVERRLPSKPVWRLNLRDLSFQFANTQVQNAGPFAQVRNARIRSLNQVLIQASSKLFSEFYWKNLRWDAGVSTDYGRVTLKPAGAPILNNETMDQVVFETELRYKALEFGRGYGRHQLGPFLNAAYDTEFTQPQSLPRRKLFRVQPGIKVFEGSRLQEFHVGAVVESDYSTSASSTLYGWATGFSWSSPVPGSPMQFQARLNYRHFAPSRLDTLDDLKREFSVNARFQMPILGNLRLSPFVDFYLFEGKLISETGHNIVFGVALDYSRLWKPLY
ncbi:MAG: hypothetical protein HY611_04415 [Elusimicrobia bacterium]|nr:hypothetical protein [Elusimicrobiota bacterium]